VADRYRVLQRLLLLAFLGYWLVFGIAAGWDTMWQSDATLRMLILLVAGSVVLEVLRVRHGRRARTQRDEYAHAHTVR
jgi:hypothetical protein